MTRVEKIISTAFSKINQRNITNDERRAILLGLYKQAIEDAADYVKKVMLQPQRLPEGIRSLLEVEDEKS